MLQRAPSAVARRVVSSLCVAASILVAAFLAWAHLAPTGPVQGHSRIDENPYSAAGDVIIFSDSSLGEPSHFEQLAHDFVAAGAQSAETILVDGYISDTHGLNLGSVLRSLKPDSRADLVIVNIGGADIWTTRTDTRQIVGRSIDSLRRIFPRARLVLVGPAESDFPGQPERIGSVDVAISRAAASRHVESISVIADHWNPSAAHGALTASGLAEFWTRLRHALGMDERSGSAGYCRMTADLQRVVCVADSAATGAENPVVRGGAGATERSGG